MWQTSTAPCSWGCSCTRMGPAAKSMVRNRVHERSHAALVLPGLEHIRYLRSSGRRGNRWEWLPHPSLWIFLGQEWYTTISLRISLPVTQSCPRELLLLTAGWVCGASIAAGSSPGAACSPLWLSFRCFAIISFAVIQDMSAQITLPTGQSKTLPAPAK